MRRLALGLLVALVGCAHLPKGPPPDYEAKIAALEPAGELAPADMKGRVVLVQFFATWCFPCLGAFGELENVEEKYAAKGLTVATVGMDLEGATVLTPFAEHEQPPFSVLVADDEIRSGQSAFGAIPTVPMTFVIGRDGTLLAKWQGIVPAKDLEKAVEEALSR